MASQFEVSAGKAIGYVSGGAVTQLTDKTTGVTLNQPCGAITLSNENLGASAERTFTVTNSEVAAGDVVIVNHGSVGTAGAYMAQANTIADGSFNVSLTNLSSGSLAEAIVLNFAVIKASAS